MKSDPLITYRRKPATLDAESLQSFAEILRDRVAGGREFHCRITNDAELRALNAQFLGKNHPTDVLSFPSPIPPSPSSPSPISPSPISPSHTPVVGRPFQAADSLSSESGRPNGQAVPLGDIAISLQRARAQARENHHSTEDEIRILLLHGLLHLLGMDHESDSGRMKRKEQTWRKKLGLPVGLIERMSEGSAK
jgi:probable rRNA maturation factor